MDRVYGPDLMLKVTDMSVERGLTHFYYGGKEGVADLLAEKMVNRFPGLRILGTYCPPFRPLNQEELASLKKRLLDLKPDFIWIGLSTPKQEQFAAKMLQELGCGLFLAVGAAFDFHAGIVSQAPRWMQRSGLEWFYRLCTEPRRLWKRYLVNNPLFLFRIFCQLSGLRKYRFEQDARAHSGSSSSP
jgi:N-acetylglucosaminyldiphosphoundecaprenol N-acetyl-beta-D-mannosaminyltransferase